MNEMSSRRQHVERFRSLLESLGVRAALRYLNGVSAHRFTALFRFEGGTLRNVHLIDRLNPGVERCPDMPVLESYCVYVRDSSRTFTTDDADQDGRVQGHPKQQTVKSYCGVPLMKPDGTIFGTICHFDYDPISFTADQVFLLEDVESDLVEAVLSTEWVPQAEPL